MVSHGAGARPRRSRPGGSVGHGAARAATAAAARRLSRTGTSVNDIRDAEQRDQQAAEPDAAQERQRHRTSAASETATVTPLKTTARPAVAIASRTASSLSAPCERSSRQRITISSE